MGFILVLNESDAGWFLIIIVAIMSLFWAYTIIDTLIRKFSKEITWVDLGAVFVLGLISGGAFGLAWAFGRKPSEAR